MWVRGIFVGVCISLQVCVAGAQPQRLPVAKPFELPSKPLGKIIEGPWKKPSPGVSGSGKFKLFLAIGSLLFLSDTPDPRESSSLATEESRLKHQQMLTRLAQIHRFQPVRPDQLAVRTGIAGQVGFEELWEWVNGQTPRPESRTIDPLAIEAHAGNSYGPDPDEEGKLQEQEWRGDSAIDEDHGLWGVMVRWPYDLQFVISGDMYPISPVVPIPIQTSHFLVKNEILENVERTPSPFIDEKPLNSWFLLAQVPESVSGKTFYVQRWMRVHSILGLDNKSKSTLSKRILPFMADFRVLHNLFLWQQSKEYKILMKKLSNEIGSLDGVVISERIYFEDIVEQIIAQGDSKEARKVLHFQNDETQMRRLIQKWRVVDQRKMRLGRPDPGTTDSD